MNGKWNLFFIFIIVCVFIIAGIRSYILPFNHDEAASFFHFIQPGDFLPYVSEPDANNHILNSLLSYFSFTLFGSSPFTLRLPNLLSIIILIYAVLKLSGHLRNNISKLILIAGLLLSFHWLSFFSLNRGYGLSMAFLIFGITFFVDYLKRPKSESLLYLFLCLQLAISANLTLIIATLVITSLVIYYKLRNKIWKPSHWIINSINVFCLLFWIKYSFYLRAKNALYYGSDDNYFSTTFISLGQLLTGFSNIYLSYLLILISGFIIIFNISRKIKDVIKANVLLDFAFLFSILTIILVTAFYFLNLIAGVNFPEDRTGLFFYVFLILALAFTFDLSNSKTVIITGYVVFSLFIIHFITQINFSRHSVPVYATFPHSFYDKLLAEQKNHTQKIIIGGYRMSELSYNFMNYRKGGYLNPMDPFEQMQMQCDYQVTTKADFEFYKNFYEEIGYDENHEFVLLKRKVKAERKLLYSSEGELNFEGNQEYYNIFETSDVVLPSQNPIIAEVDFTISQAKTPSLTWVVFYGEGKEGSFYERIPLNWIQYDWNNKSGNYCLITGNLPQSFDKIIVYLWNRKQEPLKVTVNKTQILQVEAEGVQIIAGH